MTLAPYETAIKAISDMFACFFSWRTAETENRLEKEVIEDKRDCERACSCAESAIEIAEKGAVFLKRKDKFRFDFFVKRFRKYK